jgi:hypothetical protein
MLAHARTTLARVILAGQAAFVTSKIHAPVESRTSMDAAPLVLSARTENAASRQVPSFHYVIQQASTVRHYMTLTILACNVQVPKCPFLILRAIAVRVSWTSVAGV